MPAFTVCYQGVPGAYSEKACRQLLGDFAEPRGCASFEDVFQSVSDGNADAGLLPVENSLGGSVHRNYDLLLRYKLKIIAEVDLRVEHCLLALPGVKKEDITVVMSHPQALAQCDNYTRAWGVEAKPTYDTAGSAKMIREGNMQTAAAIASDLAAVHYGMTVLDHGIEDDKQNFTRFLLLRKEGVTVPPAMPAKISLVFSFKNAVGALYKAIACFALRDIDLSKIESRPGQVNVSGLGSTAKAPPSSAAQFSFEARAVQTVSYEYLFYMDVLGHLQDPNLQFAMGHLRELAPFVRIFGCYPRNGMLVHQFQQTAGPERPLLLTGEETHRTPLAGVVAGLRIGIVGFGNFGQFLARTFTRSGAHRVFATSRGDYSQAAALLGVTFARSFEDMVAAASEKPGAEATGAEGGAGSGGKVFDVLILAPSILSFEKVLQGLVESPAAQALQGALVVDVLSVKLHPKQAMKKLLPESCDLLCTHPMFGPESGKNGWQGLPFVFEVVRCPAKHKWRMEACLRLFADEGCRMIQMTCEKHDEVAAGSQFITHFTGRALQRLNLADTPINTRGYESLLALVSNTSKDSFDLFLALYKYNRNSEEQLQRIRDAVHDLSRELQAVESRLSLAGAAGAPGAGAPALQLNPVIGAMQPSATVGLHMLTERLREEGKEILGLNIGEPDFFPPPAVATQAAAAITEGKIRYTSSSGMQDLRKAVCAYLAGERGVEYTVPEVVVCNGAKQGIYEAVRCLCQEGDEVIVPSPFWSSHVEIPRLAGAEPVVVDTTPATRFLLTPATLEAALTPRTRIVTLCNPSNPTGSVYSLAEVEALAAVLRRPAHAHVWVLYDEIYERLNYTGEKTPCFAALPGMRDRTVLINGFSKAFAMTGYRMGYVAAPRGLAVAIGRLQSHLTSCASSVSQQAALAALAAPRAHVDAQVELCREKRDTSVARIRAMPEDRIRLDCVPGAAFYLFPDVSPSFGGTSAGGAALPDSAALCSALLVETGVAFVPGSGFGSPNYIRICYATDMPTISAALDRLDAFLRGITMP